MRLHKGATTGGKTQGLHWDVVLVIKNIFPLDSWGSALWAQDMTCAGGKSYRKWSEILNWTNMAPAWSRHARTIQSVPMCIIMGTSNAFPHENNGTRVFPENNPYLMSVSLQFGRGHWNIPFGGFKLPTSELRNTEIKHTATRKTAGTRINTKHTPSHKEITNAREYVLPSIIAVSQCLHAASQRMQYMADRRQRLTATLP